MRTLSDTLALAHADMPGILAAAALRRRLDPRVDVQYVSADDLGRRLAGLADEPDAPDCWILGLEPSHSVETLVVPALERLAARGRKVTWVSSRPPAFLATGGPAAVVGTDGGRLWEIALAGSDRPFAEVARTVEQDAGSPWGRVVRAAATSWDWARIYRLTWGLAAGDEPSREEVEWADRQLRTWESARAALKRCPVVEADGRLLAVCADAGISGVVRPDALHDVRPEVDATVFVTSPSRLVIQRGAAADLTFLAPLVDEGDVRVGSLTASHTDVAFPPRRPPRGLARLLAAVDFDALADAGARARIARPSSERIDKGFHPEVLSEDDRRWIRAATGP